MLLFNYSGTISSNVQPLNILVLYIVHKYLLHDSNSSAVHWQCRYPDKCKRRRWFQTTHWNSLTWKIYFSAYNWKLKIKKYDFMAIFQKSNDTWGLLLRHKFGASV